VQDTHKKVFLQIFAAVLPPHKSPSQAPYVQIPYPNRPFGGVNRPKPACEFFVDLAQFFHFFPRHSPSSGKFEWFWRVGLYLLLLIQIHKAYKRVASTPLFPFQL
jgi:hypothetical protein